MTGRIWLVLACLFSLAFLSFAVAFSVPARSEIIGGIV